MLDVEASTAARDTGAALALDAEAIGRVQKSARVSAHRRNVQVWKSNIFRGANAQ